MFLLRLIWAVARALFAKKADLVAENLALQARGSTPVPHSTNTE